MPKPFKALTNPLIRLLASSGAPVSEVLELEWGPGGLDLRSDPPLMRIEQSETDAGVRDVWLDAETASVLQAHHAATGKPRDGTYVFRRGDGKRADWDHLGRICHACGMPWLPELFTAPALQQMLDKRRRDKLVSVPFFDGLIAGELDALVESFAGEPELYDPVRGRIKGVQAFTAFVAEMSTWLVQRNASVEDVEHVVLEGRGFEEVVLHVDGETGRVDLPWAIVADHPSEGRIDEMRIYHSSWPLTGRHANRPPLLQSDPGLRASDVVASYQRALGAGDVDAIVAAFEPEGYAREPAGGQYIHKGADGLRAFYELLFSNGGGIPLEHCALLDDGRACALEYNVVRWGTTQLPPQAGVAVYVRGQSGKLAAARIYDDADPPLAPHT